MSRFADWDDPKSTYVLLIIIFGFTSFVLLVDMMPLVAVMVFGLGLLGIFVWGAVNFFDAFDDEEEVTRERDSLAVLKEQYARGELSEEEFEHRVTMLLDVDEIAGSNREAERVTERE